MLPNKCIAKNNVSFLDLLTRPQYLENQGAKSMLTGGSHTNFYNFLKKVEKK